MYLFLCEDNIDGIFTGVYDAWASRYGHNNVSLTTCPPHNYTLFHEYISVQTDFEKSAKVARTLLNRMGEETYTEVCQAASALEDTSHKKQVMNKADALYKTIVLALSLPDSSKVLNYLGEPYVNRVFHLSRSTGNEAHHLLGFLRFQELENGLLFAQIHPKNDVLPFLGEHFSDRLPQENFMIYDATRKQAVLHPKGQGFFITDTQDLDHEMLHRFSPEELEYQKLWCGFFDSIAIEARINPKLQNQNILKRFQQDVIEFARSSNNNILKQ
ncbi:MAG: DNA metabolism protein [Lachnospiraceae bacterium]|nr:DNA metabolism protein [Lachnospiraceae bacterium]